MSNSQARVDEIYAEASRLFAIKNASYQDSWRDQGWRGNVSRVLEKAKRIRSLLWRQSVLLNGSKEHPRETLMDIMNTCAFAIINMDDGVEWGEGVDAKGIMPTSSPYVPMVSPGGFAADQPQYDPRALRGDPNEQTAITAFVGEVPTPGEELPGVQANEVPKPTPKRRSVAVTDRGSGPRLKP